MLSDHSMERAHLCAMLHNPQSIDMVVAIEDREDLYSDEVHRSFWCAIVDMHTSGLKVDPTSLTSWMRTKGYMDDPDTVMALIAEQPESSKNIESWTRQLQMMAERRYMVLLSGEISTMAQNEKLSNEEINDLIDGHLGKTRRRVAPSDLEQVSLRLIDKVDSALEKGEPQYGLMLGIPEFDKGTGGVFETDLVILAARPGVGKTAIALQALTHVLKATKDKVVIYFTNEMDADKLLKRIVSQESGIPHRVVKVHDVKDGAEADHLKQSYREAGRLAKRLLIFGSAELGEEGMTVAAMRRTIKAVKATHDVAVVVIDTFNSIPIRHHSDYAINSNRIKRMNSELRVPTILICQLNRATQKENRPPRLDDLKQTGDLEQDADVVWFIDRADKRNEHKREDWEEMGIMESLADMYLAKNRDGDGACQWFMMFDGPCVRYVPFGATGVSSDLREIFGDVLPKGDS